MRSEAELAATALSLLDWPAVCLQFAKLSPSRLGEALLRNEGLPLGSCREESEALLRHTAAAGRLDKLLGADELWSGVLAESLGDPAAPAAPEPEPVAEKPVAAKRKAAVAAAAAVKEPVAKPAAKKAAAKAAPAAPAPELDAPEPARRASSRAKAPAAAPAPAVAAPAAAAPAKRARKA